MNERRGNENNYNEGNINDSPSKALTYILRLQLLKRVEDLTHAPEVTAPLKFL